MALTFDAEHPDRPTDPGAEPRLLEALERLGVRATFFLQGRWVEAQPDRARRIAAGGHLVGNHGHYHVRMPLLSDAGLATDIADLEKAIIAVTGVDPKPWFRCAFGAGGDDARVLAAVGAADYRHVPWHVEAEDWEPHLGGDDVARAVINGVLAHRASGAVSANGRADIGVDGTIVLLHTWPLGTADGVDAIVTRLRDAGAELVGVDLLDWSIGIDQPSPS